MAQTLQQKIDRIRAAHAQGEDMDVQTLANELPLAVEVIEELVERLQGARDAFEYGCKCPDCRQGVTKGVAATDLGK